MYKRQTPTRPYVGVLTSWTAVTVRAIRDPKFPVLGLFRSMASQKSRAFASDRLSPSTRVPHPSRVSHLDMDSARTGWDRVQAVERSTLYAQVRGSRPDL